MNKDWFGGDFDPQRYHGVESVEDQAKLLKIILNTHQVSGGNHVELSSAAGGLGAETSKQ